MSLPNIKAAILANSKREEICDTLQEVLLTTTEDDLIDKALPLIVAGYPAIVDDTVLHTEFTEATLNAHGVYTHGTFTLTNPDEIFILADADVTVNVSGDNRSAIRIMGSATVAVNASDNAFVAIIAYHSPTVAVNTSDNAMVNIDIQRNTPDFTVVADDDSIVHILCRQDSTADLTLNDNSLAVVRAFGQSYIHYTLNGAAELVPKPFENATITT